MPLDARMCPALTFASMSVRSVFFSFSSAMAVRTVMLPTMPAVMQNAMETKYRDSISDSSGDPPDICAYRRTKAMGSSVQMSMVGFFTRSLRSLPKRAPVLRSVVSI